MGGDEGGGLAAGLRTGWDVAGALKTVEKCGEVRRRTELGLLCLERGVFEGGQEKGEGRSTFGNGPGHANGKDLGGTSEKTLR